MNNVTFSKKTTTYLGYFIIALWLFASFAHNAHAEIISQVDADIECHLCHNNIDKPGDIDVQLAFSQRSHLASFDSSISSLVITQSHIRPQLRAPPAP